MTRFLTVFIALLLMTGTDVPAKDYILTPANVPILGEMDPYLIQTIYKGSTLSDNSLAGISDRSDFKALVAKYKLDLFSGPMVGSVTSSSAKIWVRTAREAKVAIKYSEKSDLSGSSTSASVATTKSQDLAAVAVLAGLKPSTTYYYTVLIDGDAAITKDYPAFKTFASEGTMDNIKIAFGGGIQYFSDRERVWITIQKEHPTALLLMGDNIYHDLKDSRSAQRVYYYRRQLRPEFKTATSRIPTFSVWDDHDFCGNDCSGGPEASSPSWKVKTWEVFTQNWVNPAYGGGPETRGVWYNFTVGAVEFFMLDGRYYRQEGSLLGPVQKAWLKEQLKKSKAVFKVIASPVPYAYAAKDSKDTWNGFKEERSELFSFLAKEKISGVVLVSADRHRHDAWKLTRPDGYDLYEFMSSRMTNPHSHPCITDKECLFCTGGHGFGVLEFDFAGSDPTVTYSIRDIDGATKNAISVKLSQLDGTKPAVDVKTEESAVRHMETQTLHLIESDLQGGSSVTAYNASGKELLNVSEEGVSPSAVMTSLRSLPSGVYHVKVTTNDGNVTMRQFVRGAGGQ